MRIVSWNIRAGGGRRCHDIAAQIVAWRADVVVLSEFRATPHGAKIAASLAQAGRCTGRAASSPRTRRTATTAFAWASAFVHPRLIGEVSVVSHCWGGEGASRRHVLSLHAALLVDFDVH
jgi:hypothetical protein